MALSMVGGVAVGHAFCVGVPLSWLLLACLVSLAVSIVLCLWWRGLGLSLCPAVFLLGAALASEAERNVENPFTDELQRYTAVVTAEPQRGDNFIRLDATIVDAPYHGCGVRLYLKSDATDASPGLGDGLCFKARLRTPRGITGSNFDYPLFLKSRGIVAIGYIADYSFRKTAARPDLLSLSQRVRLAALRYRHGLVGRYRQLGLSGDVLAVASAMTLGDKSAIGPELRDVYSTTGTSHILALSGMHLGIVYTLLFFLAMGRMHTLLHVFALLLAVWSFVWLVGLSPSVVRAAVMLSGYSLVALSAREATSFNTLAFTAMVMLAASPLSLYDVGFQLSFLSVAAILLFNAPIAGLLRMDWQQDHPVVGYFWSMATMSTVAQVATAPLVAYYFEQVNLYFLVANFLVIPAASVIIYAAVGLFALALIPLLQQAVATVLGQVIAALNAALAYIAALPMSSVTGLHISTAQYVVFQLIGLAALCLAAMLVRMSRYDRDLLW